MKNLLACLVLIIFLFSCNNNASVNHAETEDSAQELLTSLQESIKKNPKDTSLKYEYIQALEDAGKYKDAITILDSLNKNDDPDPKALLNYLYKRADLLLKTGDTVKSIKTLELFVIPGEVTEAGKLLASLYAETKNPKALILGEAMIRNDASGKDPEPNYFNGAFFYNIGDYENALKEFNKCIQRDYTFLDAYMEKGRILYKQNKFKEAMDVYDMAIKVSNTFADAHYWKGKCQEALGQKEDAKISYQRAYAFDNTLTEAKEAADRIIN